MAAMTFHLKEGDLLPALEVTLLDGDGAPVDLSAIGTLTFHMAGNGIDPIDAEAEVLQTEEHETDGTKGTVRYAWVDGDTDKAGVYRGEFKVVAGGKPTTFPNDSDIVVVIHRDAEAASSS